MARKIGEEFNTKWKIGAAHALYSDQGTWFHVLERFPGALIDAHGYIVFPTEEDYQNCPQLRHGAELNVPGGISSLSGYVKVNSDDRG